jgi:RimJ/RimL family protein N-acetyltransferase
MKLSLRDCVLEDAAMLLAWRNSEGARRFSRNSDEIDLSSHKTWLGQKLSDSRTEPFWIILSGENCAGYVRFDISKVFLDTFDVSILIASEYRGLGIAGEALCLAVQRIRHKFETFSINAHIHADNFISINLFEKSGFKFISKDGQFSTFKYLPEGV